MTWKGIFYLLCGTFFLLLRFLAMTIGAWFIMDAVGVKVSGEGLCLVYAAFILFYVARYIDPERVFESERKKREVETKSERRKLDVKIAIAEMRLEEIKRKLKELEQESEE